MLFSISIFRIIRIIGFVKQKKRAIDDSIRERWRYTGACEKTRMLLAALVLTGVI